MRRILPIAIFSALLAVAPAALAQRGGSAGHAGSGGFHGGSGGFHGGLSGYGGFRGGFSAPRSPGQLGHFAGSAPGAYVAAPHVFSPAPQYSMTAGRLPVYRPAYRTAYRSDDRIVGRRGHYRVRHSGAYGYGAYPANVNSWEVVPWDLGYPDFTGYDQEESASQPAAATEPESEYEPESVPEDSYREDYAPALATAAASIAPEPQLTLIFKDGHTEQIRNYALTQDALLDLDQADSGRVARIPLASLNLSATEKAAQQAGLDFTPPSS